MRQLEYPGPEVEDQENELKVQYQKVHQVWETKEFLCGGEEAIGIRGVDDVGVGTDVVGENGWDISLAWRDR